MIVEEISSLLGKKLNISIQKNARYIIRFFLSFTTVT